MMRWKLRRRGIGNRPISDCDLDRNMALITQRVSEDGRSLFPNPSLTRRVRISAASEIRTVPIKASECIEHPSRHCPPKKDGPTHPCTPPKKPSRRDWVEDSR